MLPFATLFLATVLVQTASLDSTSPKERMDAVEQMSRPGRTENIKPFAETLKKEPRSDVRAVIVAGLGRIGGREVIPVLVESLRTDLDKDVRLQVVDSMQRLYIPIDSSGPVKTLLNRVKSAFSEPDRPFVQDETAVDPVVKTALSETMQKDFNQEVRAAAARALGSLRAKDQVPVLLATLDSPQNREHAEVRLEIVQSLGIIRDPAAGPALEKAIRDTDRDISQAAILSLGLTGYKESRALIENIFRTDTNREVKRTALESLALMQDSRSRPFFESLLTNTDDYYREIAAEGLARIDADANILKTRMDEEKRVNVRNALAFGLVAAGQDQYLNELALALDSRQNYQAGVYLVELGKFEGKLPELHRYLRSNNPKIRAGMARVVGEIGDPSSRQPIEDLTKDSNPDVVREAVLSLRKLTVR